MKIKITATLTIIATILGFNYQANAQIQQPLKENFILKGDSLVNINDRRAETDFRIFFESENSQNQKNITSEQSPWNQSIYMNSSPIFLQPANQDTNGNDGLQLHLDLSSEE